MHTVNTVNDYHKTMEMNTSTYQVSRNMYARFCSQQYDSFFYKFDIGQENV